ncbi:MAG: DEAD/DEAH box helicase [Patescibacteria group bacterium]|nr:DEAD/DEAH box helicase [Patescibacteria group bacterium]
MQNNRNRRPPRHHSGSFRRRPAVSFASNIDRAKYTQAAQFTESEEYVNRHQSFSEFGLVSQLVENVTRKGFTKPTPIQDQAIPLIMQGRDVLGIANTGTGKTAAFSLPILDMIARSNRTKKALILAPTRELAMQIDVEMRSFAQNMGIYTALCIGGVPEGPQIQQLRCNPNVVIGTPGRVKDFIEQRHLRLETTSIVVLDEVDRMLDMGFIHDVRHILGRTAQERITLFFSATMTPDINNLVNTFLKNHEVISLRKRETSHNVDQEMIKVKNREEKMAKLIELVTSGTIYKAIIFVRTKRGADRVAHKLHQAGVKVDSIHGDKPQRKRDRVIRMFRDNQIAVMVATDVAARGLDIQDVTHVINYDEPATYEDYIHRIGRTGRAEATGKAITFVEEPDYTPIKPVTPVNRPQQPLSYGRSGRIVRRFGR